MLEARITYAAYILGVDYVYFLHSFLFDYKPLYRAVYTQAGGLPPSWSIVLYNCKLLDFTNSS